VDMCSHSFTFEISMPWNMEREARSTVVVPATTATSFGSPDG